MEHYEFILIALVLLIVLCGMQIPKVIALLGSRQDRTMPSAVKTVVSASKPIQTPRRSTAPVRVKKTTPVKKATPAKKATPKKNAAVKKVAPKKKTTKK